MNENNSIFVKDIYCFESFYPKREAIHVPGRNFYSLTYRHKGKIVITCDEEQWVSGVDSITFVPKNTAYTTHVQEDVHLSAIHFDLTTEPRSLVKPMVIQVTNPAIRALFCSLTKKDESHPFTQLSNFYQLLAALSFDGMERRTPSIPLKMMEAKKEIEKQFPDPYFSIEGLAEHLQVSPAYLRREFRAAWGVSPIQYLKATRLEAAKILLSTQAIPIARIAAQCGYNQTGYFIHDFHKATGESPGRYRARLNSTP